MFSISKSLVIAVAALVSTTTVASAEADNQVAFRYDRTASVEKNYEAFARIATRVCRDVSPIEGHKAERTCRRRLLDQAVSATRQETLIAYHRDVTDPARTSVALSSR